MKNPRPPVKSLLIAAIASLSLCSIGAAATVASPMSAAQAESLVASLRLDKPGQMRVFAADGSEYTNSEAHWLQGQLRLAQRDEKAHQRAAADVRIRQILAVLQAHQVQLR